MQDELSLQSRAVTSTPCQVFILSEIRFYREGLSQLLAAVPTIAVTGADAPESAALDRIKQVRPDVVLVDISTPAGVEAMRWLAEHAGVNLVAAAVAEVDTDVHECVAASVAGYVTRDTSVDELVAILTSVARGELRCPAPLSSILRRQMATFLSANDGRTSVRLTSRELEILRLLGQNLSNKEIARHLIIEVSTVKSHVHNILEKLHVRRRSDAVSRLARQRRQNEERTAS